MNSEPTTGQVQPRRLLPAAPRVVFIGSGPGESGLMTMRGAEILATAETVVYDADVHSEIVTAYVPQAATLIDAADLGVAASTRGRRHDVDHERRFDLAELPELKAGLRHVGGEPRALHLYAAEGAEADVLSVWHETLGDRGLILPKASAIDRGYFGPVAPHVYPRIGDFLVICTDGFAVVDSDVESASALALIGHHGSTTEQELQIPLLVV